MRNELVGFLRGAAHFVFAMIALGGICIAIGCGLFLVAALLERDFSGALSLTLRGLVALAVGCVSALLVERVTTSQEGSSRPQ